MKEQQHGISKSQDLTQLARLIHLPFAPREATFASAEMGSSGVGPSDWTLDVLASFDPEAVSKIVSAAKPLPTEATPSDLPAGLPDWVRNEWKLSTAKGHIYDASQSHKGPLTRGYFVVLRNDCIYLQLQTS